MKTTIKSGLALSLAVLCTLASTAASAFYLDSTNPNNNATFDLAAGTYQVNYLGGAWDPWGTTNPNVSGCDTAGHCTGMGWYNAYSFEAPSGSATFWDGVRWATSEQAASSGVALSPVTFTLANAQTVKFYIGDSKYSDNIGGISLSVTAVPEPETYAMLVLGLGLVSGLVRSRKAKQV
jgi:hypothetical protein